MSACSRTRAAIERSASNPAFILSKSASAFLRRSLLRMRRIPGPRRRQGHARLRRPDHPRWRCWRRQTLRRYPPCRAIREKHQQHQARQNDLHVPDLRNLPKNPIARGRRYHTETQRSRRAGNDWTGHKREKLTVSNRKF